MTRTFTEAEAQRIFARVAERQQTATFTDGHLSLDDLQEAARAAGLDPALVAAAAAELDAGPTLDDGRTVVGAPVTVVRQRVVPGRLTDDVWTEMVAAARMQLGDAGIASQIGQTREWTLIDGGPNHRVSARLTAEPTDGGTRLTLSQSFRGPVLGLTLATAVQGVMALVFGALAALGVDSGLWIACANLLVMAVLFGVGAQVGARVWSRHRAARFDRLLDRLELVARSAAPPDEARTAAPTGRIDPALLDADAPESDPEAGRTRTRA